MPQVWLAIGIAGLAFLLIDFSVDFLRFVYIFFGSRQSGRNCSFMHWCHKLGVFFCTGLLLKCSVESVRGDSLKPCGIIV